MIIIPIKWLFHWEYTNIFRQTQIDNDSSTAPWHRATKATVSLGSRWRQVPAWSDEETRSHSWIRVKFGFVWKCWVYSQWNSHLIGIMNSQTIGFRGTLFSDKPILRTRKIQRNPAKWFVGCRWIRALVGSTDRPTSTVWTVWSQQMG